MLKRIIACFCFSLLIFSTSYAQLGGKYTYEFLELPYSARSASLGTNNAPIFDKDLTLASDNPSLLNTQMNNFVNLSFSSYMPGIDYGSIGYACELKNNYTGMFSIHYINYGDFIRADEYGNTAGGISAGEYSFNFGASRKLSERFYTGVNVKFIYSSFSVYNSLGVAADYGFTYYDSAHFLCATFTINNLGAQIKPYSPLDHEPLPLNVQLGFSKKLAHAPLRIVIIAHHLNIPDYTYYDPSKATTDLFGNTQTVNNQQPLSEKIFRHFIVGAELVLTKNLYLSFGYNHERRKELAYDNIKGLAGYSFGFGFRISKLYLSYSYAIYNLAGASNNFSVTVNPSSFYRKTN